MSPDVYAIVFACIACILTLYFSNAVYKHFNKSSKQFWGIVFGAIAFLAIGGAFIVLLILSSISIFGLSR
jgi:hypothetical protein